MRYKVCCNKCGRTFVAASEQVGMMRCRCPHCGHVMTCRLGAVPQPSPAPAAKGRASAVATVRRQFSSASSRIGSFQERYKNGDLVVFFTFSLLFILLVVAGLFVAAEVTRLIVSGKSWLFHAYLNYVYS